MTLTNIQREFKKDVEQLLSDLRDACADKAAYNEEGNYDRNLYFKVMSIELDVAAEKFTREQFLNE
jgi:hypothetical protein